jgi:hypothetical protein
MPDGAIPPASGPGETTYVGTLTAAKPKTSCGATQQAPATPDGDRGEQQYRDPQEEGNGRKSSS